MTHCRVCGNEVKPKRKVKVKPKPKSLPPIDLVRNIRDLLKDDDD